MKNLIWYKYMKKDVPCPDQIQCKLNVNSIQIQCELNYN